MGTGGEAPQVTRRAGPTCDLGALITGAGAPTGLPPRSLAELHDEWHVFDRRSLRGIHGRALQHQTSLARTEDHPATRIETAAVTTPPNGT